MGGDAGGGEWEGALPSAQRFSSLSGTISAAVLQNLGVAGIPVFMLRRVICVLYHILISLTFQVRFVTFAGRETGCSDNKSTRAFI